MGDLSHPLAFRERLDIDRNPALFEAYLTWWANGEGASPAAIAADAGISTRQLQRIVARSWELIASELGEKAVREAKDHPARAAQIVRRAANRHWKRVRDGLAR